MPSSWSSRFLHNASSASTPNRNARASPRDKPLPATPTSAYDSPTLSGRDGERAAAPSPPRPQQGVNRSHTHNRSVSHPLPKIFGRKKSAGNLGGYHDTEVPLDEDLVPVLDEPSTSTPMRGISGKNNKVDDDDKMARKCMCCDSRVKVPRELEKFRCMCCLTINDLKPVEDQPDSDKDEQAAKKPSTYPGGMSPSLSPLPLSVERTRALIDRCITSYLEARCRREEDHAIRKPESPAQTPEEKENPMNALPMRTKYESSDEKESMDAPMSTSPPDTPHSDETLRPTSAAIRDFSDFDQFAYMRKATPPPSPKPTLHGPGPPGSVQRKPVPAKPNRKPPLPPMTTSDGTASQRLHPNAAPNGESSNRLHQAHDHLPRKWNSVDDMTESRRSFVH